MLPFDSFQGTSELLKIALSAAVPLRIMEYQNRPWNELHNEILGASQVIAEHGDKLMFRSKKPGETAWVFNTVAKALAVMSFVPGGVKFLGMHFEAKHKEPGMAVGTHRPITFQAGTMGRFVQRHGIKIEARLADRNPEMEAVADPWAVSARHYTVRLSREDGREMVVPFSKGIDLKEPPNTEEVLQTLAIHARDYELALGDILTWSERLQFSPTAPSASKFFESSRREATALRAFLDDETYAELLDMATEQKW